MQPVDGIAARIRVVHGQRVMLGPDLAALYGVDTRALTQAVRRNAGRFPADFLFSLSKQEVANLKSQTVISSWGGSRKPPLAFTEHGAIMAATVLNSRRAIQVSLFVVRAFVQLRDTFASNKELARRLDELERKLGTHDRAIGQILDAGRLQLRHEPAF